jgi:hypothetical protein
VRHGDVTSEIVLADCAAQRGYDPGKLAPDFIDEESEEQYRATSLDYTIDSSP